MPTEAEVKAKAKAMGLTMTPMGDGTYRLSGPSLDIGLDGTLEEISQGLDRGLSFLEGVASAPTPPDTGGVVDTEKPDWWPKELDSLWADVVKLATYDPAGALKLQLDVYNDYVKAQTETGEPPYTAPKGYHWEPKVEGGWNLSKDTDKAFMPSWPNETLADDYVMENNMGRDWKPIPHPDKPGWWTIEQRTKPGHWDGQTAADVQAKIDAAGMTGQYEPVPNPGGAMPFTIGTMAQEPEGQGYATKEDAEAAIAGRTDLEVYPFEDGTFGIRQVQAPEPDQTRIIRGEDINPALAGQIFQQTPDGRYIPFQPPSLNDMISAALQAGDIQRAIALDDFAKRPGGAEQLQMALDYAKSPLDYDLVLGMAQGTIPLDAPRYRAVDKLQGAMGQLFPGMDARALTDNVVQSIQMPGPPQLTHEQRMNVFTGMTGPQAEQAYRSGQMPSPPQTPTGANILPPTIPQGPPLFAGSRDITGAVIPGGQEAPQPIGGKPYVGLPGQLGPSGAPIMAPSTEEEKAARRARNRQQAMALAGPRGSIPEYTPLEAPTKNVV
ncbi:MAG: hypothetical protein ABID84_03245, partial [Chloroflexota bacterium]